VTLVLSAAATPTAELPDPALLGELAAAVGAKRAAALAAALTGAPRNALYAMLTDRS